MIHSNPWHRQQAWCKQPGENVDKKPSFPSQWRGGGCVKIENGVLEDSRRAKTSPRNRLGQEDPSPRISFPVRWAGGQDRKLSWPWPCLCQCETPAPGHTSLENKLWEESWALSFLSSLCLKICVRHGNALEKVLCSFPCRVNVGLSVSCVSPAWPWAAGAGESISTYG